MSAYDQPEVAPQSQPDRHREESQTPFTGTYPAPADAQRNMGPPPPVDHGLDHWHQPSVLNAELDGLMSPSPGYSSRYQDRTPYPEPSHILGDSQPHIQLPSMRPMNPDPRPLVRYTQDTNGGPWNPQQVSGPSPMDLTSPRGYIPHSPAHPSFSYPRSSPRSDGGSSNNSRRPQDSGYVSRSVISNSSPGFENQSQGSHSITGPMNTMDIDQHSYGTESIYAPDEPYAPVDNGPNFPLKCNVEDCPHVSKNQSEFKKHMSRHTKPHKCRAGNCPKHFSTNNDLERHMKSVHKIAPRSGSDKSYRCAALNCTKKEKIWPRLDNFRQHCSRIHKGEDTDELVRKSEVSGEQLQRNISLPEISVGDPALWQVNPWEGSSSDYTHLPTVSLSQHPSPDASLRPPKRARHSGSSSPISTSGQETPPVQQFRGHETFGGAASPIFSSIQLDHLDATQFGGRDSQALHQAGRFHHAPGLKRPRSMERLERPESADGLSRYDDMSDFKKTRSYEKPRSLSLKDSTELKLNAQELSQELSHLVRKFPNTVLQTGNNGELESAINDHLHKFLDGNRASNGAGAHKNSNDLQQNGERRCKCDQCPKSFKRRCDLRKHKKRHSRPYGCTFEGCTKKFGSKNDWKRHENTRHYRIEAWRCHEPNSASKINQCAKVFHRREQYQTHLKEHHNIKDDGEIRHRCQKHRVGRNGQSGFWCGFCQQIVPLAAKGLEAWDERFAHIDTQHFSKGMTIDSWYPLDKDIPIGSILSSSNANNDESPLVSEERSSSEDSSDECNQDDSPISPDLEATQAQPSDISAPPLDPAAGERPSRTKAESKRVWFCCKCGDGPNSLIVHMCCNNCSQRRCERCEYRKVRATDD